jgi:hypothetical protein
VGSISDEVNDIFYLPNPSSRTKALGVGSVCNRNEHQETSGGEGVKEAVA